ncbi:MAG TPA: hypothetical protein VMI56_00510 [Reyranella sp.]|nr:hypothetical protein [Reyranella sp.]
MHSLDQDRRPIAASYEAVTFMRETLRRDISNAKKPHARVMEGELFDLYAAIVVAIPLLLLLKSLWP